MGENHFTSLPAAIYGAVLLFAAMAYYILQRLIIAEAGHDSQLASSFGRDWKGKLSPVLYAIGIGLAFFRPWAAGFTFHDLRHTAATLMLANGVSLGGLVSVMAVAREPRFKALISMAGGYRQSGRGGADEAWPLVEAAWKRSAATT